MFLQIAPYHLVKGRRSAAACWYGDRPGTPSCLSSHFFAFFLKCHEANQLHGIIYLFFITTAALSPLGDRSHNFIIYEIWGVDTYLIAKGHAVVDTLAATSFTGAKLSQYVLNYTEVMLVPSFL
jgi:hypothetical protein